MTDYTYNPEFDLTDFAENQDIQTPVDLNNRQEIKESTSLNELDEIELANRNSEHINVIPDQNNMFPDPLKQPLYQKVVPEGGVFSSPDLVNQRTKTMSSRANRVNKEKQDDTKLGSMTVNELLTVISNSLIGILNDLLTGNWDNQGIISVFTKEQRLFSIGVVFVIISIFFIFFKKSV